MNNFAWAVKTLFWISGAPQAHFGSFKGLYQRGYYCREHLYSQTSLKAWDSEEKQAFSSRLPLSCHIAWLATYPIDPGILISLYTSAHQPYTTLATGQWMIFWPGEDTGVEVRSTECSRYLVFQSSLHVRLLPATLQFTSGNTVEECHQFMLTSDCIKIWTVYNVYLGSFSCTKWSVAGGWNFSRKGTL